MIVDGEIDPKRRHRPQARGGEFVVLRPHRHVPRAEPSNVNEATDRYHPHRGMVERFQQRILLANSVELEGVVRGNPVSGRGAARRNGRPKEAPALLILGNCCRRKHDRDKQSCRKNSTVKHAATIGRNVLLL
jgi:hypothetical protein